MLKYFDIASGLAISSKIPSRMRHPAAVIAPSCCIASRKALTLVERNLVLDSHQYRASVGIRFFRGGRVRPMIRWGQVRRFRAPRLNLAHSQCCQHRARGRNQQGGGNSRMRRNPAPQQAAERHPCGEDHDVKG